MKITSTALSLNVADTDASAHFAKTHFGFTEAMADDGFVSLNHPDAGVNVVFLRTGLGTFKPDFVAGPAGQGMLIAFVVDDLDAEFSRIAAEGASVVTEPETEPWGERYCQFVDPTESCGNSFSGCEEPECSARRTGLGDAAVRSRTQCETLG